MNSFAKALKQISGKRKKTDSDHEELAHIEFLAGLYMGPDGPILPGFVWEAGLINAAKKHREGPLARAGLIVPSDMPLQYDGPTDPEEMYADGRFADRSIVRVTTSRIARTRPIFKEWSGTLEVQYEDTIVNPARVEDWVRTCGSVVGMCDWRPRHGRFSVTGVANGAK